MLDQNYKVDAERNQERRKIILRVVVAAVLLMALLAALLFLEQNKETAEVATPLLVKPDIGVSVSSASAPALSEEVQAAIKDAPDMAEATLASMSEPLGVPEPAPAAAPVVPEGTLDPSVKPIVTGRPAPAKPAPAAKAVEPRTGKPAHNDRLFVESSKLPPPQAPASAPAVSGTVTPAAPLANGNFVVQLGVFNSLSNAEDLRSKLKQAGIPSQLETRVQVGPFSSKEEAIKAQEKLRTLGLGNGMLVSAKKP